MGLIAVTDFFNFPFVHTMVVGFGSDRLISILISFTGILYNGGLDGSREIIPLMVPEDKKLPSSMEIFAGQLGDFMETVNGGTFALAALNK